jgi:cytochrome oxidase Cu insertion factor (SCO1/SenC/PrrC family)
MLIAVGSFVLPAAISFLRGKQMRKLSLCIAISLFLAVGVFGQVASVAPTGTLKVGDLAPDFTLNDTNAQKVKLSDFRGKNNVVLAFYVFAFTGG